MDVESVEYRMITEEQALSEMLSSGQEVQMETSASTELERLDDASTLINNNSAKALSVADRAALDIQRLLRELGIRANVGDQDDTVMDITASVSCGQGQTFTGGTVTSEKGTSARRGSTEPCVPDRSEQELLQRLFRSGSLSRYVVRDQHMILGRVMHSIFREDRHADADGDTTIDHFATLSRGKRFSRIIAEKLVPACPRCQRFWKRMRAGSRRILYNPVISGFYLALTIYSLFSLDLVVLFGTKDIDEAFWIAGSAVFLLFFFELIVWSLGVPGYILTMPFLLDVTALISVYGDTWFARNAGLLSENDQASRLSRMARTSKMTRLARIVRVARITKLIPELLRFLRKQNTILAKQVLHRRLWRVFLFLDADEDGLLCSFDIKVFYIAVLQECPHLFFCNRLTLLQRDVPRLEAELDFEDESSPQIDFETFAKTLESLELGRNMVRFHLDEVEQEEGVWTLTQRLSDRTAMKVCVGILVLITMISFLEVLPEDHSVSFTLAQLTSVAKEERKNGLAMDATYLCDQIGIFVRRMADPHRHKVLFLYLDGFLHYDAERGGCLTQPDNSTDPLHRAEEIRAHSNVRDSDFTWVCWPVKCLEDFSSACLVDMSFQEKNHSKWAVITIVMVILLLLIFVYGLNQKIRIFSGKLLQPLQTLLDDMAAMACLELVHLDKEMPGQRKQVQVAEELQHLQTAFKGMRSAIRSWSKYVPPCIVERLLKEGAEASVGVARCHATILFADIVDFEAACHDISPNEVLELLTSVFGCISDCVQKRNGVLLEFIGPEVLAVFNTPSEVRFHALLGVLTALDIHSVVKGRVQVVTSEDKEVVITCKCGVHTGQILAGNIGSHRRMKYGLLGDGINLAARLKGLNSRYHTQTLCSASVLAEDRNRAKLFAITRPVDRVAVKGKSEPTTVHEVMSHNGHQEPWLTQAAKTHAEAFDLYQAKRFQEALDKFGEVYKQFEKRGTVDEPSRLLQERCVAYLQEAPPSDWDGVDRLTKKTFDSHPPGDTATTRVPRVVSMTALPSVSRSSRAALADAQDALDPQRVIQIREDIRSASFGQTFDDVDQTTFGCAATLGFCAICNSGVSCGTSQSWEHSSGSPRSAGIAQEDDAFHSAPRFVAI